MTDGRPRFSLPDGATVRGAAIGGRRALAAAGVPDPEFDAWALLSHALGRDRMALRLDGGAPLPEADGRRYAQLIGERAKRIPLQYLVGSCEFMGISLRVDGRVLIPRAATETLARAAIGRLVPGMRVLDLGTGSGAIAIALKRACPGIRMTAADVSGDALAAARENAAACGAEIEFVQSDCFSALGGRRFHMIVSNPPYIPDGECAALEPEVLREPRIALRGGRDGLDFYRAITAGAPHRLFSGGWLLFEIGWRQKEAVAALLRAEIGTPFAERDDGGRWRVVGARRTARGGDEEWI